MTTENAEQIAYWNGNAGQRWTERQQVQDILLAPISKVVIERADARPGERVIDVGCGCGDSTLTLAERVGGSSPAGRGTGHVTGIDVSEPMLARARERTPTGAPVTFIAADAATHAFQQASVDLLFSRFGVMFFARPDLAFANLRTTLRPDGRLVFVCWRTLAENPWFGLPLEAVYRHVAKLPASGPEDPGPFSFADEARVRRILTAAGFRDIDLEPVDTELDLACGAGLDGAVATAMSLGPAGRALDGQPDEKRSAAAREMQRMLEPYRVGANVRLGAAVWIVTARPDTR